MAAFVRRVAEQKTLFIIFQILYAYPFFLLLETRSPAAIVIAVTLGLAFGNGAISSVQPDYFGRFFATNVRYSGISLGRESATVIGAGLAPVIATVLVSWAGASWPVAACMAGVSILGLLAVVANGNVGAASQPVRPLELSPIQPS